VLRCLFACWSSSAVCSSPCSLLIITHRLLISTYIGLYNYISYKMIYFTIVTVYYVHVYVLVWPVLQDRKSVTCIINQWKIGLRTMATFDDRHELVNLTVDQQQKLFILQ
jgi:hypothetical protein